MLKNTSLTQVRIDKWLWAARFYKTRPIAVKAIKNGQISRDNTVLKPASMVSMNDIISIKKGPYQTLVEVLQIRDKRVSATLAQEMFKETDESIQEREKLDEQLANQPKVFRDRHKPDKRAIRNSRAAKRGE